MHVVVPVAIVNVGGADAQFNDNVVLPPKRIGTVRVAPFEAVKTAVPDTL
jgi:hypothetical protein